MSVFDLCFGRQNISMTYYCYFIYPCILHYYRMFSIPFQSTLYVLYTSREVFIWRINYCHYNDKLYTAWRNEIRIDGKILYTRITSFI